jgi:LuxR family maltose regulon positive regulatory protein
MLVGNRCLLGRAAMALDQDNAETGRDFAQRCLRAIPAEDLLERAAGLELLVQAHVMLGNSSEANAALQELRVAASHVATNAMQAALCLAEGRVAAISDLLAAKACFEDAAELFTRSGAPFEAARTRVELGRTLSALGRDTAATEEILTAARTLNQIGASHAARQAQALARGLHNSSGGGKKRTNLLHGLTGREIEVLALTGQGLTNREIAIRICRSEHTVHRHVANILAKLGLPSRAAAASFAAKHGLL